MIEENSLSLALSLLQAEDTIGLEKPLDINIELLYNDINTTNDNKEERIVYGVVLRPNRVDEHSDVMNEKEVRDAAHFYLAHGNEVWLEHIGVIAARPVESFIAPVDFQYENGAEVKKGDWVLATQIYDDALWNDIKEGRINEYSPHGPSFLTMLDM